MSNSTLILPVDTGSASVSFITISSALVFLMCPGVGLFYAGMVRAKNVLSLIFLSVLAMAVVSVQWFLFGFSLSFSETASPFIGDFSMAAFMNVGTSALSMTAPTVPAITFALYQLQFAGVTPAIIFGSVAERIRLMPSLLFIFVWTTLVYDFAAYWSWGIHGWIRNMHCLSQLSLDQTPCLTGALDFAGGGPVHITSGFAGLAATLYMGTRKTKHEQKPHDITLVFLGTAFLWFGWFGFNGGSALSASGRASMTAFVTTLSGSVSGLTWILFDYAFTRKLSGVGFCSGVIAGLVVITPGSGFVAPWAAMVMGIITGITINLSLKLKDYLGYDDALDAFALHGLGGFLGNVLTGIFAQKWVAALDGTVILGGAVDGVGIQLGYQLAASFAIAAWSFIVSYLILFVIDHIPGMELHISPEHEDIGIDLGEMGEMAYHFQKVDSNLQVNGGQEAGALMTTRNLIAEQGVTKIEPVLFTVQ